MILGICIKIDKLTIAKRCLFIHISRWHTFNLGALSSITVTRQRGWRSGQRWRRFWSRCTRCLAPPVCLWNLWASIMARKAAISLIFMNHCRVSFYRSLHLVMPRNLNTLLHLFMDFGLRFLNLLMRFLYWGVRKLFFGHSGHIQGKAHVALF